MMDSTGRMAYSSESQKMIAPEMDSYECDKKFFRLKAVVEMERNQIRRRSI